MADIWNCIFGSPVRCEKTATFLRVTVRNPVLVGGLLPSILIPVFAYGSCARNGSLAVHVHVVAAGKDADAGVRSWILGPRYEHETAHLALDPPSRAP